MRKNNIIVISNHTSCKITKTDTIFIIFRYIFKTIITINYRVINKHITDIGTFFIVFNQSIYELRFFSRADIRTSTKGFVKKNVFYNTLINPNENPHRYRITEYIIPIYRNYNSSRSPPIGFII